MGASLAEAKGNLLRLREEFPLTEEECAVVEEDIAAYEHLLAHLANVAVLDG